MLCQTTMIYYHAELTILHAALASGIIQLYKCIIWSAYCLPIIGLTESWVSSVPPAMTMIKERRCILKANYAWLVEFMAVEHYRTTSSVLRIKINLSSSERGKIKPGEIVMKLQFNIEGATQINSRNCKAISQGELPLARQLLPESSGWYQVAPPTL